MLPIVPKSSASPKNIPGLHSWWDFGDPSSITLNSSTISRIEDKSGNNRYMSQPTALLQPVYNSNLRANRSGAVYDASGTGTNLEARGTSASDWKFLHYGSDKWSIFFAGKVVSISDTYSDFFITGDGAVEVGAGILLTAYNDAGNTRIEGGLYTSGGEALFITKNPLTENNRSSIYHLYGNPLAGSPSLSLTIDDDNTIYNDSQTWSTEDSDPPYIFNIGGVDGSTTKFNGEVYEVMIYRRSSALSAGEITFITNYLKNKWGI